MMVLIDRKFNAEQLLLETFFPKMHIERGIRKKLILKFILGGQNIHKKNQTHVTAITYMAFPRKREKRGLVQWGSMSDANACLKEATSVCYFSAALRKYYFQFNNVKFCLNKRAYF